MKHVAIVLAAGNGKRMGGDCPKQYIELEGKPILYYCLKTFEESFMDEVVLVTREEDIEMCRKDIVDKYGFKKIARIVAGGRERYESVCKGITAVNDANSYVYIHDGARAFVSLDILERTKKAVEEYSACLVCVPSKDTIKVSDKDGNVEDTPKRSSLWCAQTPQAFKRDVILKAFEKMFIQGGDNADITDDASVVEKYSNYKVKIVEGDYTNIKITTPEDLAIAKMLLK